MSEPHVVMVPYQFSRQTMYPLLDNVIDRDLNPKASHIKFDFNQLAFIEPTGITILSNLFEWLMKRGTRVTLSYPAQATGRNHPITFLDDSGFFKRYLGQKINPLACVRDTTMPLEKVTYDRSFQWLNNDFVTWLTNTLDMTTESIIDFKICLEELFNNIKDHAKEDTGCIFSQYYPRNNEVKISISDFGVGIPHNVKSQHPTFSDSEALLNAIQEGFSTQSTPRNRGVGLHTLVKNVVEHNQGCVYIHSNNGILSCMNVNNVPTFIDQVSSSFYPGTLIEIVLKVDNIEYIPIEEEETYTW
ncbi:ATP-binding protein [Priestia aryabhattai]|uniref:ATP-binding protein n=1 Tax=Priestia aryabhattai TaxID=412384 RepID=UPI00210C841A|nr:ATP-binding protein [Priestia aryabhattai]